MIREAAKRKKMMTGLEEEAMAEGPVWLCGFFFFVFFSFPVFVWSLYSYL